MRRLAVALVHHPVLDRQRAIVTTAITNLDLHDISRSAHAYGLSDAAGPIHAQREPPLACASIDHGPGSRRIPTEAGDVHLASSGLDDAIDASATPPSSEPSAAPARSPRTRPPVS
jgi:hypothetical protein